MFFIIKKVFWVSLLLVILSNFYPEHASEKIAKNPQVELIDFINVTNETFFYAYNICNTQPKVCTQWKSVFSLFKQHVLHGADVAYKLAKSSLSHSDEQTKNRNIPQ
ncbi:MAG: hypothetical protein EU981_04605 [Candidatus Liberibacter ctenarytainae]|uniref:Uncharacterized protein n=1 Tax=Candidatus Liberibacter ctenarytainae TaxID=2020335 RepID=A0A937AF71_9HYPH|nr:hypothetical protein [Candidatus Liberibacter ctenarytainae]